MSEAKRFTLTADHVKLLRRMYVTWQDCETGAPEIDPKRPYGNSDVAGDVAEILGVEFETDEWGDMTDEARDQLLTIHGETQTALQVVLATGSFEPGDYETSDAYRIDWRRTA